MSDHYGGGPDDDFDRGYRAGLQNGGKERDLLRAELAAEGNITDIVRKFIRDNGITSPETIHQCDWVIENAYEFIEKLCDAVGYLPEEEDDE